MTRAPARSPPRPFTAAYENRVSELLLERMTRQRINDRLGLVQVERRPPALPDAR